MTLFPVLLRLGLGGAFVWAGMAKLDRPEVLAVTIDAFGLVPAWVSRFLAHALPPLEIGAGLALMLNIVGGLEIITALLVTFSALLGYGLRLGLDIDCGCYGPADPEAEAFGTMRAAFVRDLGMLAAAAVLFGCRFLGVDAPRNPLSWIKRSPLSTKEIR